MNYFLWLNNTQAGPYTIGQLRGMWSSGTITSKTLYWKDGMGDWKPASQLISILEQPATFPSHAPFPVSLAPERPTGMISTANVCFVLSVLLTLSVIFAAVGTIPWLVNIILMIVLFCHQHPDARKAATRLLFWNIFFIAATTALIIILWMRAQVGSEWIRPLF